MCKMKISLDTNILIDDPKIVFDKSREFVLSFTVIRELDHLKRNPDLKRAAQMAIKCIWAKFKVDEIEILNIPNLLGESPDEAIIQDSKEANASILSNDIAVRIIAKAHGVSISDYENDEQDIDDSYTGYRFLKVTTEYESTLRQLKEMPLDEFNHYMECDLKHNEYAIIDDGTQREDIWKNANGTVRRITQKMGPYTAAGVTGIQPMDAIQMCVLDAVSDPDVTLTIIDGPLGTGKTMLTLMAALSCTQGEKRRMHYDRILVTASPESVNKNLYTGYKPGESTNKLGGHLGGFKSNLKFLLDPKKVKENRKGAPDAEAALMPSEIAWMNLFEIKELDEIQGESLHDTIFLVDEWQKLGHDTLKMALSRIAEGSKAVLMGDTVSQVYGLNRGSEGFKTLYPHLGTSKYVSYIKLENIYRSPLAEFVAEIFE